MVTVREFIADLKVCSLDVEVYIEGYNGREAPADFPVSLPGYVLIRSAEAGETDLIEAAIQHEELRREAIADEEQRLEQIGG